MRLVIVNANYFHGYVSMMQINRFQFQFQVSVYKKIEGLSEAYKDEEQILILLPALLLDLT